MRTKKIVFLAVAGIALAATVALAPVSAQEPESLPRRILKWSEADQVAWLKSYLADGMPSGPGDTVSMLALNRSSITLPILEEEIEAVLRSTSPHNLFASVSADPQRVVVGCISMIQYAGDEHSLEAASKLMKIDAVRFGGMVYSSMIQAANGSVRNPFTVAYQGFEIGDLEVDERIVQWADKWLQLGESYDHVRAMRSWAEAMVEKYNGVPSGSQWTSDPIVSRLDPAKYGTLHDVMLPLVTEAAQKRLRR